jgi:hypothetical protein
MPVVRAPTLLILALVGPELVGEGAKIYGKGNATFI